MADVKMTVKVEEKVTYLVEVTVGQGGWDRAKMSARYAVSKGKATPVSRVIETATIISEEVQPVKPRR